MKQRRPRRDGMRALVLEHAARGLPPKDIAQAIDAAPSYVRATMRRAGYECARVWRPRVLPLLDFIDKQQAPAPIEPVDVTERVHALERDRAEKASA